MEVGDQVLILLPTDHNKLLLQWKGPYTVVHRFNDVDYKVKVKDKVKTFHINLLKKYIPRKPVNETSLCIFESTFVPARPESINDPDVVLSMEVVGSGEYEADISDGMSIEPMPSCHGLPRVLT